MWVGLGARSVCCADKRHAARAHKTGIQNSKHRELAIRVQNAKCSKIRKLTIGVQNAKCSKIRKLTIRVQNAKCSKTRKLTIGIQNAKHSYKDKKIDNWNPKS